MSDTEKIQHLFQLLKKAQRLGLDFHIGNAYISRSYIEAQSALNAEIQELAKELQKVTA